MSFLTEKYLLTIVKRGERAEIPLFKTWEIAMIQGPVDFSVLKDEWRPSPLTEVKVFLYAVGIARGDRFLVILPSNQLRFVRVANGIVNNAQNVHGVSWKAACLPGDEVIALQKENDGKYVLCEILSYSNH